MKERGILFSKPMVLALLDGSKTQTRRLVKPQPMESDGQTYDGKIFGPEMYEPAAYDKHGEMVPGPEIFGIYTEDGDWGVKCPYGMPRDQLWVRESWRAARGWDSTKPSLIHPSSPVLFTADESVINLGAWDENETKEYGKLRPSMFMPRWSSRIDLEITGVRVERLQDISEEDAMAEGIQSISESDGPNYFTANIDGWNLNSSTASGAYQMLWEWINGAGSWDKNPWLWVVEFRRITK